MFFQEVGKQRINKQTDGLLQLDPEINSGWA